MGFPLLKYPYTRRPSGSLYFNRGHPLANKMTHVYVWFEGRPAARNLITGEFLTGPGANSVLAPTKEGIAYSHLTGASQYGAGQTGSCPCPPLFSCFVRIYQPSQHGAFLIDLESDPFLRINNVNPATLRFSAGTGRSSTISYQLGTWNNVGVKSESASSNNAFFINDQTETFANPGSWTTPKVRTILSKETGITAFLGYCAVIYMWARLIEHQEFLALNKNPYLLFERRIWVPVSIEIAQEGAFSESAEASETFSVKQLASAGFTENTLASEGDITTGSAFGLLTENIDADEATIAIAQAVGAILEGIEADEEWISQLVEVRGDFDASTSASETFIAAAQTLAALSEGATVGQIMVGIVEALGIISEAASAGETFTGQTPTAVQVVFSASANADVIMAGISEVLAAFSASANAGAEFVGLEPTEAVGHLTIGAIIVKAALEGLPSVN